MDSAGWRMLIGGKKTAAEQMACDRALAQETIPTVRFFMWEPAAVSLGWKQPSPEWVKGSGLKFEVVERPTGGGMAFHGSDLSITVVVPRVIGLRLETLMSAVCQSAVKLCDTYGADVSSLLDAPATRRIIYCLAETSPYAVIAGGKKVAGFALRRYPETWLIQGSLLVRPIPCALKDAMPAPEQRRLESRAIPLARLVTTPLDEADAARRWAEHWPAWWEELLIDELSLAV